MDDERGAGKVGVVGTGMVGSSFAYALMQRGLADELVLVDKDHARAEGEAMDLNHGLPFVRPMRISAGSYAQLAGCEVVVITAARTSGPARPRSICSSATPPAFLRSYPQATPPAPTGIS